MRITLLLLTFFEFIFFAFSLSKEALPVGHTKFNLTNFDLTGRIVNGTKASFGQFPHQVSLRRSWNEQHFCGGSIISPHLVLTAAHCMFMNGGVIQPWSIMLVAGTLKLNGKSSTRQERGVENIRLHPEFNHQTLQNDIAVLELSVPFNFTPELHSAKLPRKPPVPDTVCQVSGWGYPARDDPTISNDLMYVDLPVRSKKECRILLVNITDVPEGMFCAGWLDGGKDACQGDSGGGMVCNDVLTGIVSGGEGCALPRLPGVYSDIFYYIDWISENKNVIIMESECNNDNGFNGSTQSKSPMITMVAISIFFVPLSIAFCP